MYNEDNDLHTEKRLQHLRTAFIEAKRRTNMDYSGIKCPVCGVFFHEHDDIVVCPECGAPYHRACYEKAGHCIFTEKHGTGEAWQPPKADPPEAPNPETEPKDKRCGNCGRMNAHSALFCDYCGYSLSGDPAQYNNTPPRYSAAPGQPRPPYPPQQPQTPPYSAPGGWPQNGNAGGYPPQPGAPVPMPFMVDPMGGYAKEEPIDDGVTAGEVAEVVQNNSAYYMLAFRTLKTYGRTRFHFCAFLFSGGWFLYRKQYKLGAILTALMLLLTLGLNWLALYMQPQLLDLLGKMGIDITSAITAEQQAEGLLQLSQQLPWLMPLSLGLNALRIGIMVFCGVKANKFYYQHCVSVVRRTKESIPVESEEYKEQLHTKGGVNVPIAVCIFVCYMIINYLPQFINFM